MYLVDHDVRIGIEQGRVTVKDANGAVVRSIPFERIDGISVFGKAQLTTQLIRACLANGVAIGYYTEDGHYLGSLGLANSIDPSRQKKQAYLMDDEAFCLEWSKRVVTAKIANSLAFLRSESFNCSFSDADLRGLLYSLASVSDAETVEEVMGYEGNAARCYFACLPKLVTNSDFAFSGRSSRPPKDPFNAMLSYGYSLLHRNVVGAIERHGLHPYFAFLHKLKRGHAALASDVMEDLRALVVDSTVLGLVNSMDVTVSDFTMNESGAMYMNKTAMKSLTNALTDSFSRRHRYYASYGDGKSFGLQVLLDGKVLSAVAAIESADASLYRPLVWNEGIGLGAGDGNN